MWGEGRGVEVGAAEGGGGVAGVNGVGGVEELEDGGGVCPGGYGEVERVWRKRSCVD